MTSESYIHGDEHFWERLEDMPDDEADEELRRVKTSAVIRKAWLESQDLTPEITEEAAIVEILIMKVNARTWSIRNRMEKTNIRIAIRALFGEEGYARVVAYKRELEAKTPLERKP